MMKIDSFLPDLEFGMHNLYRDRTMICKYIIYHKEAQYSFSWYTSLLS